LIHSLRPHPVLHRLPGFYISLALSLSAFSAADCAELSLSSSSAKQGQPIEVTYTTETAEESPTFVFGRQTYKLFPSPGAQGEGDGKRIYKAILSPSLELDPGVYTLKNDNSSVKLKVLDGKFQMRYLTLPKSKDNFNTSPGEEEAVNAAKETLSPHRLWSGNFIRPSKARTSTPFGVRRTVNGKFLKDYFHSGLDFAGYQGSPVVATAPGTVVMARTGFKLHGNCIAIDHGQGIVSFYIHLKKLNVVQGQQVKAGQLIGQIGQTGRANGPHLHFSIYCNKAASNPNSWFANAIK
jgi:murein DD-endopeptidase MepM/ murein hydrolase activator NlpD